MASGGDRKQRVEASIDSSCFESQVGKRDLYCDMAQSFETIKPTPPARICPPAKPQLLVLPKAAKTENQESKCQKHFILTVTPTVTTELLKERRGSVGQSQ